MLDYIHKNFKDDKFDTFFENFEKIKYSVFLFEKSSEEIPKLVISFNDLYLQTCKKKLSEVRCLKNDETKSLKNENQINKLIDLINEIKMMNGYLERIESKELLVISKQIIAEANDLIIRCLQSSVGKTEKDLLSNETDVKECLLLKVGLFKNGFYSIRESEKSQKFKKECTRIFKIVNHLEENEAEKHEKLQNLKNQKTQFDSNELHINQIKTMLLFCFSIEQKCPCFFETEKSESESLIKMDNLIQSHSENDKFLVFKSTIELNEFVVNFCGLFLKFKTEYSDFKISEQKLKKLKNHFCFLNYSELMYNIQDIIEFATSVKSSTLKTKFNHFIGELFLQKFGDFVKNIEDSDQVIIVELTVDQKHSGLTPITNTTMDLMYLSIVSEMDKFTKSGIMSLINFDQKSENKMTSIFEEFKSNMNRLVESKVKETNKINAEFINFVQKINSIDQFLKHFITHSLSTESVSDHQYLQENLRDLTEIKDKIVSMNEEMILSRFRFKMQDSKLKALDMISGLMSEFASIVQAKISSDWDKIIMFTRIEKKHLIEEAISEISELSTSPPVLETFRHLENRVLFYDELIEAVQSTEEFAKINFDFDNFESRNLHFKKWQDFKFLFEKKKTTINEQGNAIKANFESQFEFVSTEFEMIFKGVLRFKESTNLKDFIYSNCVVLIETYEKWSIFESKNKSLLLYVVEFRDFFKTIFTKLKTIQSFFDSEIHQWKHFLKLNKTVNEFSESLWINARFELFAFQKILKEFCKIEIEEPKITEKINQIIDDWFLKSRLLNMIIGEDFSVRNWNQILLALNLKLHYEKVTVFQIVSQSHFSTLSDEFEQIRTYAKNEKIVTNLLEDLMYFVHSSELKMREYRFNSNCESLMIFTYLEKVEDSIQEKLSIVFGLNGNLFAENCQDRVELINKRLKTMEEIVQLLKISQQKWMSLFSIMTSEFIKNGKKSEYMKFDLVNRSFSGLLVKCAENKLIHALLEDEETISNLKKVISTLDQIQKNLFEFLELKRIEFPRFYFLGDSDLIEFLGNFQNETAINSVITKFIPSVKNVLLNSQKNSIIELESLLGENFVLENEISLKQNAQNWLSLFIEEIRFSILAQFYKKMQIFDFELESLPTGNEQILSLIFNLDFGRLLLVENGLPKLKEVIQKNIRKLVESKPEFSFQYSLKKSLLLDSIFQLQIVERSFEEKDLPNSFLYYSLIKYNLELFDKSEASVKNCRIFAKLGSYKTEYTCEYLGNQQKLVQTPLTEKCFLTMASALAIGLGGNPYGPAGTGKTESIKALGGAFGRLVIVFNCDETMDFRNMSRLFMGIVGSGAWGCFDEFNRLDLKELSAISQVISQIQTVQKIKNSLKVEINGTKLQVPESVGIFITLNPMGEGYRGRNKLPYNLKVLFRSFAMNLPNSEIIVKISLVCVGFQFEFACQISKFLVSLFESASKVLDLEKCYDWGLRGLKSLITQAEFYIQQLTNQKPTNNDESNSKLAGTSELKEIQMKSVYLAIETNILTKLVEWDKKLFEQILAQTIKQVSINLTSYCDFDKKETEFKQVLKETFEEFGLLAFESQITSCLKISYILTQKIGFGIIGKTLSGKSTLFEVLKNVMFKKENKKVKLHKLCPKSMGKMDLFGCYVGEENEFQEGIFVKFLRDSIKELGEKVYDYVWIILEGNIDPNWAENLNSALDDNKLFTLVNGERLTLPNELKIIFESDSFENASMATISRLGILNHQLKEEEIEKLIDRFMKNKQQNISNLSLSKTDICKISDDFEIDKLVLSKTLSNSKIQFVIETSSNQMTLEDTSVFYCNKKTSIKDFIQFVEKCMNNQTSKRSFEIQINDLDIVQSDEFGTRFLEELLIQIHDHGWAFFQKRLINLDRIRLSLKLIEERRIRKLSSKFVSRLSIPEETFHRIMRSEQSINSSILDRNHLAMYHLFNNSKFKKSVSLSQFEILKSLCENSQESKNKDTNKLKTIPYDFFDAEKFTCTKLIQQNSSKIVEICQSLNFFKVRFRKLITGIDCPTIENILFVYSSETFAELSLQLAADNSEFEVQRLNKSTDFSKQIFEAISAILKGKKVLLLVSELNAQNDMYLYNIDVLCNYSCFSYFIEDYKRFSGKSNDDTVAFKLRELQSNFKVVVMWNKANKNEFEQILNSYSCFSRNFTSIIDDDVSLKETELIFGILLKKNKKQVSEIVAHIIDDQMSIEKLVKFSAIFEVICRQKTEETDQKLTKFINGIQKINATQTQIDSLKTKITQEKSAMSLEQHKLDDQINQISISSMEINSQKSITEKLTEQLQAEKTSITLKKESINLQLEAVVPIVEEAKQKIKSLSKSNIDELRNYHIPPDVVLDIFGVLLRLMSETDVSWNNMKKILGKRTVIEQIVEIDPRKVSSVLLKEIEIQIQKKPDSFHKEKVAKISVAAAPIAEFVTAIVRFVRTVQNIKPLEKEFVLLTENLHRSESKLKETQTNVEKIVIQQKQLKKTLQEKSLEIEEFKMRISSKEQLLQKATYLLLNLKNEKNRWSKQHDNLVSQTDKLVVNSFAASYYLINLTAEKSQVAKQLFKNFKKSAGISNEFSLSEFLIPHEQMNAITLLSLSKNKHNYSTTFGLINFQFPVIIYDPEQRNEQFFTRYFTVSETLNENNQRAIFKLELSIKLGKTIIIQCDKIPKNDFILDALNPWIKRDNGSQKMRFGDKLIDFNDKFRIFVTIKQLPKPCQILNKLHLFNYSISKAAIQNQILSFVINWQKPELEKDKIRFNESRKFCENEIYEMEEKLLTTLNQSKANVLEDQYLFAALTSIKEKSEFSLKNLNELQNNLKALELERKNFEILAYKITSLIECILSLKNLNVKNSYSNDFLFRQFQFFIQHYSKQFDLVHFFTDYFETVVHQTCLALDSESKLSFLLLVANAVSLFDSDLNSNSDFSCILNTKKEHENQVFENLYSIKNDKSEDLLMQMLQKKLPHLLKTEIACNSKMENEQHLKKMTQFEKLFFAKSIFPEKLAEFSLEYLREKLSKKVFEDTINVYKLITNSFCKILLIFGSSAESNANLNLENTDKTLTFLIGTIPVQSLSNQLIAICEKEKVVFLKNVHAHYDSFVAIIKFIENYSNKFHANFRLILSTENPENLPMKLIENSMKYSVSKDSTLEENIKHTFQLLDKTAQNDKISQFGFFHSFLLERMKYVPIGWSSDYEFGEFELGCFLNLQLLLRENNQQALLEEVALKILYFAKVDNENDKKIMQNIHSKLFSGSQYLSREMSTERETYDSFIGLQHDSVILSKLKKTKAFCKQINDMKRTIDHSIDGKLEDQGIAIFDKFTEFWGTYEKKLNAFSSYNSNNSLISSFIDSELAVFQVIFSKLKRIHQSISDYGSCRIKLSEVLYSKELTSGRVPVELLKIWQNKTQISEYLHRFFELSNKLRTNFSNLSNAKFEIDLNGIICYKKLFEILKILKLQESHDESNEHVLAVSSSQNSFFKVKNLFLQGASLTEFGELEMLKCEDKFYSQKMISDLNLTFLPKTPEIKSEYLDVQFFNNAERSQLIGLIYVKTRRDLAEFFTLSSIAFYVHE